MPNQTEIVEIKITEAIKAYNERNKPPIAPLAREFDVPYQRLRARIQGRGNKNNTANICHALNPIQEKALIAWINSLHAAYIYPTPNLIERSANMILQRAGADRIVGHNWVYRFIKRLPPDIAFIKPKIAEKQRVESEEYGPLLLWFNNLRKVIEKYDFQPNEIFNWDETGYQIGQGQRQKVIAPHKYVENETGGQHESITGIECISADGWVMLPWFLPKGSSHMEEWYLNITIPDFRIKPTPNGWIDDDTAFEWLCSFHEATKARVRNGRPRLLLMDNHGSHATYEFIEFCTQHFIIPIWFLPHTTHICQPLDGPVFQSLKHYFRAANTEITMWGGSAEKKGDFFRMIYDVRKQAFTQRTIRSSFKSRGIWPFDPEVILAPLRQKSLDIEGPLLRMFNTPSPQPEPSSSATNSPPNTTDRVNKLNTKILDDVKELGEEARRMRRHIRRSMDANILLSQRLALCEADLRKARAATMTAKAPRNRRTILGTNNSVLSPANANRRIAKRQEADSQKAIRIQAKHAKELAAEQQAQLERDREEAEIEAREEVREALYRRSYGNNYSMY